MESDIEWTEENSLNLIEAYKLRPILWNPKHEYYFKKPLKYDAWHEIAELLAMSDEKCRNKMIILLSSYRREKAKETKSKGLGKGASDVYKSRWFAYSAMQFLEDRNKPRKRKNTESLYPGNLLDKTERAFIVPPKEQIAPTLAKKIKKDNNNVIPDAMQPVQITAQKLEQSTSMSDEIKSFVTFIGTKMTNYSVQTKTAVQHAFFDIIVKADTDFYEK